MIRHFALAAALAASPAIAQQDAAAAPSPGEIIAAAPANAWTAISPDDLLVMDLASERGGQARRVVIQLISAPFSQPWIVNLRKLAKAKWWDGLAIVRAQDNYVVQWGDPDGEDAAKARPLPPGMTETSESDYVAARKPGEATWLEWANGPYANHHGFFGGWPIGWNAATKWPVHCYGMVGVGRNNSPDAGTGAELYTVIGHAPRHLDRNIALVGRVIEGIEHLSTLPRGTGALGFYETPEERTAISSIRLGTDVADLPAYQFLSTESETFAAYAEARANRRDAFFIAPAGGADICNVPVPVRRAP
jgi:peptidylprolyl isomerase